jgi:hypothetical protein
VYRPWAGPLVQVLVIDDGDTITSATRDDIAALGLGEAAVWRRALANMRTAFPAAITGPAVDESTPNVHIGHYVDSYGAARLVMHERWNPIAAAGSLLVAAPARDIVLWVTNPSARVLRAFHWLAQQLFAEQPHPISPAVFRWTPSAWELESANTSPIR